MSSPNYASQTFVIDLAIARATPIKLLSAPGKFLTIPTTTPLDRSGALEIRLNSPSAPTDTVRLGDTIRASFDEMWISNGAQAGHTMTLKVGFQEYEFWPGNPGLTPPGPSFFGPANPAAGANLSDGTTLFAGNNWRVSLIKFRLVTDATAADRTVRLVLTSNGSLVYRIAAPATQQASETCDYIFSIGAQLSSDTVPALQNMQIPLPDSKLIGAVVVDTAIANIQVGDQISAVIIIAEQW